jgi:hypothetical protein
MIAAGLASVPVARPLHRDRLALLAIVGLAGFVAASHLEAAVGAFSYSPVTGVAVAAFGLVAAGWTVRVARRPTRGALLAGAGGALALVALWIWTRAAGVPFADGRAPVGVLDTVTAFDELLLAWLALAAARARGSARERWPLLASVAISLSFIVLAMGCDPARTAAAAPGGSSPALICHLY